MSLADFQLLVNHLVRDKDQVVSSPQYDTAIQTAVIRYSADRPRAVVADVVSAGGYRLALPVGFDIGFSKVQSIEHPVGNVPETLLEVARTSLYNSPVATEIQLPTSLPVGDTVRLGFTARHRVDVATDTVPIDHRNAVASWAAALLCDQLANHYATSGESSIGADAVNHQSKTETFASRARAYRAQYLKDVGVDEKRTAPASAMVDLNLNASHGGSRLFPRGRR